MASIRHRFGSFRRTLPTGVGFTLTVLLTALPAAAQSTREEAIAQLEAEKAKQLSPPVPSPAERVIIGLKEYFIEQPGGFFPTFDSVYPGGGFTLGGGYRRFYGDRSLWAVTGLYSLKSYKRVEALTLSPDLANGRLSLGARVGWRDAPEVAFYGLGMDNTPDDRTNFRLKQTYVTGDAMFRPNGWTRLGGGVAYEDYSLESGRGTKPSIETVFTPATAPGLGDSPAFVHSQLTAAIDWRTSPGYTRTGGYYGVTLHDYADTDDVYSFDRLQADVIQHLPILRETWVISLRGRVETTLDDEDIVPYFLLPSLGSGSTLRAYPSWRFRDRHSLLMSAEWRWIPNRLGLDMAIFYDAGKVAPERSDLDFDGLKSNVGIGIRFHTLVATPLRIEMARGSEGWNLVFSGSHAF